MAKKAFLVGFAPLTRIIVDIPDGVDPCERKDGISDDKWHEIVRAAREKMAHNIADYLNGENCDRLEEDLECPFGTFPGDKTESPKDRLEAIVRKHGESGRLECSEDEFDDIQWTFICNEEAYLLSLETIITTDDTVFFEWKNEIEKVSICETLEEIDAERLAYVFENLPED